MKDQPVFRAKNQKLAERAVGILGEERPMTLRQLYYRCVSAGLLANKQVEYKRLGTLMTRLRESGQVPRTWIVDHVRATLKPSSWSGLADFSETVREAYRKDFWASLPDHVEVFVEKDAIAGTIQPITREYDIALRVCRGYASVSFAGEIADEWSQIEKPIYAYYLGDYDPSGFDLERDLREKLERYSGRLLHQDDGALEGHFDWIDKTEISWKRLAVREEDFSEHDLIELPVKEADRRSPGFLCNRGSRCAEVDALSPSELRRRVEAAIEAHIDQARWQRLQVTEAAEKRSLSAIADAWQQKINLGSVSEGCAPQLPPRIDHA